MAAVSVLTIGSLDPLDSPLQVDNQDTRIFQGSVSMSHNLSAFIPDATKGNFLLFVDPFHKQIYQIDFTDSNPTRRASIFLRASTTLNTST